jgi:hypothetical protein
MNEKQNSAETDPVTEPPHEWVARGEELHEQGLINRTEAQLGSQDAAAIKAGHVLTPEGRAAIAASHMREPDEPQQMREAA